jgi:hypothetical protein
MKTVKALTLLVGAVSALAACGTGPGPDLSGPDGAAYLSAYSGDWILLRLDSDDLAGKLREMGQTRPGATGNMPGSGRGGGMTGRRPPGGMTTGGGRMPGGAGGMRDPEEMRRVMEATRALSRTPTSFSLTLRPASVTLLEEGGEPLRLELGADETGAWLGKVEFFAKAEWTADGLVIQRMVDGGGGVKDEMWVDDEGRLVVEREIDTGRLKVEGVLRFRKSEG